jgi:uncharacterized glyoxalase superfamily metalloenzyme YdcJ
MYAKEVPLYGKLLPLVEEMNKSERLKTGDNLDAPLVQEHHGAIRVGNLEELHNIARLFATMNMQAVNYYDLSAAGLPVYSTAFRDVTREGLAQNAFRVFCSVLRHDLLDDESKEIAKPKASSSAELPAEFEELKSELTNYLDVNVDLKRSKRGKGSIVIPFGNDRELNRLLKLLKN